MKKVVLAVVCGLVVLSMTFATSIQMKGHNQFAAPNDIPRIMIVGEHPNA